MIYFHTDSVAPSVSAIIHYGSSEKHIYLTVCAFSPAVLNSVEHIYSYLNSFLWFL